MENIHSKDEKLIRDIFNKSAEAWNTNNIELFSECYTPDVDYLTFMGDYIKGLDANIKVHRELWNSYFMRGSALEGEIISIKFKNENAAIMIAKGGVKLRFQKKMPADRMSINHGFSKAGGRMENMFFSKHPGNKLQFFCPFYAVDR